MSVSVVFAIAGVIALFLSVWGGGIKAKEIEIPQSSPKARLIVGAIGSVLIGFSILLDKFPSPTNTPETLPATPTLITVTPLSPTLTPTRTTFTETPVPSPTLTSVPTLTVEEEAEELLTQATRSWKLVVLDTFDKNNFEWPVGEHSTDDQKGIANISMNGKYHVDIQTGAEDAYYWIDSKIQIPEKFYLATDARCISTQSGCAMALAWNTSNRHYIFTIYNEKNYIFQFNDWKVNDVWNYEISKTTTDLILPQGVNRLSVINDGTYIWLYINDKYVGRAENKGVGSGNLEYYVYIPPKNAQVTIEFDNLELRNP